MLPYVIGKLFELSGFIVTWLVICFGEEYRELLFSLLILKKKTVGL
jgi:hypothetical protein